jgi:hypothetical protein
MIFGESVLLHVADRLGSRRISDNWPPLSVGNAHEQSRQCSRSRNQLMIRLVIGTYRLSADDVATASKLWDRQRTPSQRLADEFAGRSLELFHAPVMKYSRGTVLLVLAEPNVCILVRGPASCRIPSHQSTLVATTGYRCKFASTTAHSAADSRHATAHQPDQC